MITQCYIIMDVEKMVLAWSEVQSGIWLTGLKKATKNASQPVDIAPEIQTGHLSASS